jgi:hypothetical protein
MRSTGISLAGALTGAGILSLALHVMQRTEPTEVEHANRAASPQVSLEHPSRLNDEASALPDEQARRAGDKPQAPQVHSRSAPDSDEMLEWNALVGGMLEWEVERRTGQTLDAETGERLVSELGRLREASLALQESPAEPGDSAELRERLTQTLALVQVDQTFRKELGVGVAEFLQGLNSGVIEDVAPASTEP